MHTSTRLCFPRHSRHASRPKVFPLAFSISVCLGIRPITLVISGASWVRASLANRVHLLLFSLGMYKHGYTCLLTGCCIG